MTSRQLLPPLTDEVFDSFNSLLEYANSFARSQGYAIIKRRSCNYDSVTKLPRRYDLACDLGGSRRPSRSTSCRRGGTRTKGCPFAAQACQYRHLGDKWALLVSEQSHNHELSIADVTHPTHRVITAEMLEFIDTSSNKARMPARMILEQVRTLNPDVAITEKDIYNAQRK
ncbi:hypothetical protein B0J13DRAFT_460933, partial [Dactylonectria estremocensis]